jgi:oligopeptide transport system permease protein
MTMSEQVPEKTPQQPSENKFVFVQEKAKLSDVKMETKKIGYFADALYRFSQNKGSIVAAAIIFLLALFAIIAPLASGYGSNEIDPYYTNVLPKVSWSTKGSGFWDGTSVKSVAEATYYQMQDDGQLVSLVSKTTTGDEIQGYSSSYTVRYDTYRVACRYKTFTAEEIHDLEAYDAGVEADEKVLQPLVDFTSWTTNEAIQQLMSGDANYSYKVKDQRGNPVLDAEGKVQHVYKKDASGNYVLYSPIGTSGDAYQARIDYDNYYVYIHGHVAMFTLGSDSQGRDLMTRLGVGARFSLLFSLAISAVNIIIGVVYGAIEGYYGGVTDIVMERIVEILSEVPFIVVMSLFKVFLVGQYNFPAVLAIFIAYVATDWIGTASTVRMQFYRYKNQEYVLAARTLGASDKRLIFKHILPNAAGTIITSVALMVPYVIFSESTLSYLGIINFDASDQASIGTMLASAQANFTTYPNSVLWPALYISLLMICFNIFGNGLRDAFNPQLRGAENG